MKDSYIDVDFKGLVKSDNVSIKAVRSEQIRTSESSALFPSSLI
jgi:hypothetical protein